MMQICSRLHAPLLLLLRVARLLSFRDAQHASLQHPQSAAGSAVAAARSGQAGALAKHQDLRLLACSQKLPNWDEFCFQTYVEYRQAYCEHCIQRGSADSNCWLSKDVENFASRVCDVIGKTRKTVSATCVNVDSYVTTFCVPRGTSGLFVSECFHSKASQQTRRAYRMAYCASQLDKGSWNIECWDAEDEDIRELDYRSKYCETHGTTRNELYERCEPFESYQRAYCLRLGRAGLFVQKGCFFSSASADARKAYRMAYCGAVLKKGVFNIECWDAEDEDIRDLDYRSKYCETHGTTRNEFYERCEPFESYQRAYCLRLGRAGLFVQKGCFFSSASADARKAYRMAYCGAVLKKGVFNVECWDAEDEDIRDLDYRSKYCETHGTTRNEFYERCEPFESYQRAYCLRLGRAGLFVQKGCFFSSASADARKAYRMAYCGAVLKKGVFNIECWDAENEDIRDLDYRSKYCETIGATRNEFYERCEPFESYQRAYCLRLGQNGIYVEQGCFFSRASADARKAYRISYCGAALRNGKFDLQCWNAEDEDIRDLNYRSKYCETHGATRNEFSERCEPFESYQRAYCLRLGQKGIYVDQGCFFSRASADARNAYRAAFCNYQKVNRQYIDRACWDEDVPTYRVDFCKRFGHLQSNQRSCGKSDSQQKPPHENRESSSKRPEPPPRNAKRPEPPPSRRHIQQQKTIEDKLAEFKNVEIVQKALLAISGFRTLASTRPLETKAVLLKAWRQASVILHPDKHVGCAGVDQEAIRTKADDQGVPCSLWVEAFQVVNNLWQQVENLAT
eukprot:TRINITY_DN11971_c0_g1_i5.p1 TRINITY_DN11971_c0_g1~~TRINITY_DN11971_c0_g1_i5.p1  ORF type:complete len:810 (-),score=22.38 TRINITY_DN11971_c0_g1_i5:61-2448(-)